MVPFQIFFSKNTHNIVNSSNIHNFEKICYVILRLEYYGIKRSYKYQNNQKPTPLHLTAILRGSLSQSYSTISLLGYNCKGSAMNNRTLVSKYRIAAGPGNHSVIILKEIENSDDDFLYYEVIEFIEHVTYDYINFYFKQYY